MGFFGPEKIGCYIRGRYNQVTKCSVSVSDLTEFLLAQHLFLPILQMHDADSGKILKLV